jgi:hypothetical protein
MVDGTGHVSDQQHTKYSWPAPGPDLTLLVTPAFRDR